MTAPFRPAAAWDAASSDPADRLVAQLVRESAAATRGVGLFGVPFDGAVIGRPGARLGPSAIRAELVKLKPWTVAGGEITTPLRDFGDADIPEGAPVASAHAAAEAAARAVLAAGLLPLALGGDHSLSYPLVRAHAGRRVGVVNLDAHLDLRDVVGGRVTSGTPFGRLLDHPDLLSGRNLVEVGIRDFATSPSYGAKAAKHGVTLVPAADARADPRGVARDAVARAAAGTSGVYLSIDMDVLDAAHGPGVSAPTPGGLDSGELLDLVRAVVREVRASSRLLGVDIVETAPPHDEGGRTARAAAYAAMAVLAEVDRA